MALKKSPKSKKESQSADLKEVWGQKKPEGAGGGDTAGGPDVTAADSC